ncbi:MAG: uracil-DNA glycosylase [Chloroflexi bacterium]|jgi:DNA polymerase|nr:MAG: uracil-DNA glycosylase [Chloroflexota bacterium]
MVGADSLALIADDIRTCRACPLCESATQSVPGSGATDARLLIIGEAPGAHEDKAGMPFVGASGKVLDKLLHVAGVARSTVFIANVVKHRPPQNRDPLPAEVAACAQFLQRQIAVINPLLIVPLGRYAAARWIPGIKISSAHGIPQHVANYIVVPMLHPATALYQPRNMAVLEADFQALGVLYRTVLGDVAQ